MACWEFYHNRTLSRMNAFLSTRDHNYKLSHEIWNHDKKQNTRGIFEYMEMIDWEKLCTSGLVGKMHGDLQFDNIIYCDSTSEFKLIDWRENFAHMLDYGDVYYDLSKLYGGMIMGYHLMRNPNNYTFQKNDHVVEYSWNKSGKWNSFKTMYKNWVTSKNLDFKKIELLTALIFLNMSPLHCDNFDDILFFHSKFMLSQIFP